MKVPDLTTAEQMLAEAQQRNPGVWVAHNRVAAICAKKIASQCEDMDENIAYVLGLLHDIGRREGTMDLRHIWCGYQYMLQNGYDDSARICLTHSFPSKEVRAYNGSNDCSPEITRQIQEFLDQTEYNDYDKLIQLCDAVSYPSGPEHVEKRLVDVVLRKGFDEFTLPKWKALLAVKQYFDEKAGKNIDQILAE